MGGDEVDSGDMLMGGFWWRGLALCMGGLVIDYPVIGMVGGFPAGLVGWYH